MYTMYIVYYVYYVYYVLYKIILFFKLQLQLFLKCKGSDIKSTTYTIMGNLMSNSVAMLHSLEQNNIKKNLPSHHFT